MRMVHIPTVDDYLIENSKYARGKLLDVGCGSKPYFNTFPSVESYLGIDVKSGSNADIIASGMSLPIRTASVDTVLSIQVMEHVPEPYRMITEMFRVLRHGGYLLLTVPQTGHLHGEPNDYYRYTKHGLQYLLEKSGFVTELIKARGGFWCTLGNMLTDYIMTTIPAGYNSILKPFVYALNLAAPLLDRLRHWELDTIGYLVVAKKP